jgi:hypothetical protein
MSVSTILRISDKWSKRRFTAKLSDDLMPHTIGGIFELAGRMSEKELNEWIRNKRITPEGIRGFEYIQQALFDIRDDGTLGDVMENAFLTYNGFRLTNDDSIPLDVYNSSPSEDETFLADLILDRDNIPYKRNWLGYYHRNWTKEHADIVNAWVKSDYPDCADDVLAVSDPQNRKKFIFCIAKHIYSAPYELYSRFLGTVVPFKTASETLTNVGNGRGGNCSEKASVLDFICTNFGIDSKLCLSGHNASGKFPEFHLRAALERSSTIFTGENQRYWEHFANIVTIDGSRLLIDATGGPMPFLFCADNEADEYLDQKKCLHVKYIARDECFYYHDAPRDIAYGALFNMEVFLPDIDMYHIFGAEGEDSPFGLLIKPDLWICPDAYITDEDFSEHLLQWNTYASSAPRITQLEMYKDLQASKDKKLISVVETSEPALIRDLRSIEEVFVERCRHIWRDERWNIGYVFCSLKSTHPHPLSVRNVEGIPNSVEKQKEDYEKKQIKKEQRD